MAGSDENKRSPLKSRVVEADFFKQVGYSTVWEDERIIAEGLRPGAGESALSITSGGDFTLQLLTYPLAEIISLDFNPHQTWLLELKTAAVGHLDHDALWELLGLTSSRRRRTLYQAVRPGLSPDACRYWDAQHKAIEDGFLRCGRQDRYLHLIGRLLGLLQGEKTVRRLFEQLDAGAQQGFFDARWNTRRWRILMSVLLSRRVLDRAFDPEHFRYARADQHPASALRRQAEAVVRDIPVRDNFYLYWLFYRTYPDKHRCPAWLRAERFETIRDGLPRLRLLTGELEQTVFELPDNHIDCFNFSNIFDWVGPDEFISLMREVVRVGRQGARLCYWTNMVNTRRRLSAAASQIPELVEDDALARRIFRACRTPGYGSCTLGHVEK